LFSLLLIFRHYIETPTRFKSSPKRPCLKAKSTILRFKDDYILGQNTVYHWLKKNGCMVTNRLKTAKPRVKNSSSKAEYSDQRWAMDVTHIPCGTDG